MIPTEIISMNETKNWKQTKNVRNILPFGDKPNEPFNTNAGGKEVT